MANFDSDIQQAWGILMILEGIRGGSRAPATSKMERFVIIVFRGYRKATLGCVMG